MGFTCRVVYCMENCGANDIGVLFNGVGQLLKVLMDGLLDMMLFCCEVLKSFNSGITIIEL